MYMVLLRCDGSRSYVVMGYGCVNVVMMCMYVWCAQARHTSHTYVAVELAVHLHRFQCRYALCVPGYHMSHTALGAWLVVRSLHLSCLW